MVGVIEKIFRIFPIDDKKICVSCYFGKRYGDNPKYIVEEFHRRPNAYKIIWVVKNMNDTNFRNGSDLLNGISLQFYNHLAAWIWIDNCRKHRTLKQRKPKNTSGPDVAVSLLKKSKTMQSKSLIFCT